MLLEKLKEYGEREKDGAALPLPPLYNMRPIRYIIELDAEGRLLNPEPSDTVDASERALRRGRLFPVPDVTRAVGIRPLLLADKADYTLGYAGEGSKPERVAAVHEAYLDQLERCAESTGEADVHAVLAFLRGSPLERLDLDPEKFDPSALITFRIDGSRLPTDLESVQAFWAAENTDADAPVMQCIVCGQERPVLGRLQGKIKGIPGGQMAGTSIISANAEAFESYGLDASLIAPTCAVCGEKFTKGANELLGGEATRSTLGSAAVIAWTREDVEFDFFGIIEARRPEQVRDFLASLRRGGRALELDDPTQFYVASLSASGGRTVIRDWIDISLGELKRHLERWFRLQRIVNPYGEEALPLGLRDLATATVRDPQDLPTPTARALLHAALTGTPLPWDLLYQAVRRNRAERSLVPPRTPSRYAHKRVALIKLVLASHHTGQEDDYMVQLDSENSNPAYRCGRLLAVLEEAQRLAIPGINATIVDRYYGTASSAPASVYGNLLDGARSHLSKLKRDRPGAYLALQRRIEDILGGLTASTGFPRTLPLEQQGMFALGYYHQRAFDRAQAAEARARRERGELTETEAAAEQELGESVAQEEEAPREVSQV